MLKYGTIETALVFLRENKAYTVGDILIGIDEQDDVYATGSSNCFYLQSITKAIAIEELKEIKETFLSMVEESPDFADFVNERKVNYHLVYDEGKCGIGVCSEVNDVIIWHLKFNQRL